MPSFDVVSEVDSHELSNAVDQTRRELENRFDFRGVKTRVELEGFAITLAAESEFQVQQMEDILHDKLTRRGIDISALEHGPENQNIAEYRLQINVRNGIDKDTARKIVKAVKSSGIKVQAQIQQEQVRVNGKKRDELQQTIAFLKQADIGIPLQFDNFRD